jgi:hypothetical protein
VPSPQVGNPMSPHLRGLAGSSPKCRVSRVKGENAAMDGREAAKLVPADGRGRRVLVGPDAVMRCIADAVDYLVEGPVRTYVIWLAVHSAIAQRRDEARGLRMRRTIPGRFPTGLSRAHVGPCGDAAGPGYPRPRYWADAHGAPLWMSTARSGCPRSPRRVRHLGSARPHTRGRTPPPLLPPATVAGAPVGRLRRQLRRRRRTRSDLRGMTSMTASAPTAAGGPRRPHGRGAVVHRPSS